jgi:tol-pal system protein YbgF
MKKILPILLLALFGCSSNHEVNLKIKKISERLDTLEVNVSDNRIKINSLYSSTKSVDDNKISEAKIEYLTEKLNKLDSEIKQLKSGKKIKSFKKNDTVMENNASQIYQQGREYYLNSQYNPALQKFNYLIDKFPTDPLAANSLYWKGEVYYDMNDYVSSIAAFQNVIDYYPKSQKAPDAQFKIGLCYVKMNNFSQAIIELKRIKKLYPNYERQKNVEELIRKIYEK